MVPPWKRSFLAFAKAAFSSLELRDAAVIVLDGEIRPQHRGEEKLGIGALIEQEIAQAHLSAGADEQINIRQIMGIQPVGKGLFIYLGKVQRSRLHLLRDLPGGPRQLGPQHRN